jgi:hypothetical protein
MDDWGPSEGAKELRKKNAMKKCARPTRTTKHPRMILMMDKVPPRVVDRAPTLQKKIIEEKFQNVPEDASKDDRFVQYQVNSAATISVKEWKPLQIEFFPRRREWHHDKNLKNSHYTTKFR